MIVTPYANAQALNDCQQINKASGGPDNNFRPPAIAKVVGKGRAYFYSAPAARCLMKHIFVIPGDRVTVYKPYLDWYQVMFINTRTGDETEGWIKENRLELAGQYGRDSS